MRGEKRKQKDEALERHVFEVATRLIGEGGFEKLTIRDICAEAGISTGMFYRHFKSKDYLFTCYYDILIANFNDNVADSLNGLPLDEQIVGFESWLCDFTQQCGLDFCRSLYASTNNLMNTDAVHNRVMDITDSFIETAVARGFELSDGRTPHAVSKDLCLISKGVIFDWCAHGGTYDMGERARSLFARVIESLL